MIKRSPHLLIRGWIPSRRCVARAQPEYGRVIVAPRAAETARADVTGDDLALIIEPLSANRLVFPELLNQDIGLCSIRAAEDCPRRLVDVTVLVFPLISSPEIGSIPVVDQRKDTAADANARSARVPSFLPGGAESANASDLLNVERDRTSPIDGQFPACDKRWPTVLVNRNRNYGRSQIIRKT